jgi:hypothetical protein
LWFNLWFNSHGIWIWICFKIQFCVIELLNYCSLKSRIETSVLIDLELELQPLDCQISVLLDLELELIFPCSQMHSPPHINVIKLFNWASYDCCHSADICKWWLATIPTLNPINLPKWLHLSKNNSQLCYVMSELCSHIGKYLDFLKKELVATWVLVRPDRGIAMGRLPANWLSHAQVYPAIPALAINDGWNAQLLFSTLENIVLTPCAYGTTYAVSRVSIFQFNFGKNIPPMNFYLSLPFGRLVCGRKVQSLWDITRQKVRCSLGAHLKYRNHWC